MVITNLDLSKALLPNCMPVVVAKNREPELSYILTKLVRTTTYVFEGILLPRLLKCLIGGSCISDVGEMCMVKNYSPV